MICFVFFPPFDSFLSEPLWGFMDAVHGCQYSFIRKAFPANYSFTGRKNLQEIHFKPPDQAGRPNFASDKTKPVTKGKNQGKTRECE